MSSFAIICAIWSQHQARFWGGYSFVIQGMKCTKSEPGILFDHHNTMLYTLVTNMSSNTMFNLIEISMSKNMIIS